MEKEFPRDSEIALLTFSETCINSLFGEHLPDTRKTVNGLLITK